MAKRIPGLPPEWQQFAFCLAFHVTLPLLPLAFELWFTGSVEEKSIVLTAAMYSIAIGLSSRNLAVFGLGLLQSIIFSAAFGFLSKNAHLDKASGVALFSIVFIMSIHIIERFNRHVIDQSPFLEFGLAPEKQNLPPH